MAKLAAITLFALALAAITADARDTKRIASHARDARMHQSKLELRGHVFAHSAAAAHKAAALGRLFGAQQSSCVTQCTSACQTQCGSTSGCASQCPSACEQACAGQSGGGSSSTSAPSTSRCDSAASSAEARAIQSQCGALDFEFGVLFDHSNSTQAAHDQVNRLCSSGCLGAFRSAVSTYGECFDSDTLQGLQWVYSACTMYEGETCAWRMRAVEKLDSCDGLNNVTCPANPNCRWHAASHECESAPTVALLQEACTPCFDRFIMLTASVMRGQVSQSRIDLIQRTMQNSKDMVCAKVGDTWCMPFVDSIDDRVFELEHDNNMTLAALENNITNMCSSTGKRCANRVIGSLVNIVVDTVMTQYQSCLSSSSARYYGPRVCRYIITSAYEAVNGIQTSLDLMCSVNSTGGNCGIQTHRFVRAPCFNLITRNGTCDTMCASWLSTTTSDMGCCMARVRDTILNGQYPDGAGLPTDVQQYYQARRPNATVLNRFENHPLAPIVALCNRSAANNSFNTAATVAVMQTECPAPVGVNKSLPLQGLRWSRFENNATLKALVTAASKLDVERSIGSEIVNATLEPDASQRLTDGSTARRQSTSTVGTKFTFAVVGTTAAEAEANAAAYDTAVASNEIAVTSTAQVVQDECTDCVGSPTAAPGQTAAPPPTGALFASLVGADTSGTDAPATSSASGAATFAAVAAALAALVL